MPQRFYEIVGYGTALLLGILGVCVGVCWFVGLYTGQTQEIVYRVMCYLESTP